MTIESHLASLEKKHDLLDKEIATVSAMPATDELTVTTLKRKKLLLKEQIEKIRDQVPQ